MGRRSVIWILASLVVLSTAAWLGPVLLRARSATALNTCVNNLRVLAAAKEVWASENRRATNDVPTWGEVRSYLRSDAKPECPQGGAYTLGRVGEAPTCSVGGLDHSLAFDDAKGRRFRMIAGLLALLSVVGLLIALLPSARAPAWCRV